MNSRVLVGLGLLAISVSAVRAEVRLVVKDGRRLIYNDGPANIASSEAWLAARVKRSSAFDDLITSAARDSSVDPKLVKSVMLVESGFNPAAISRKGARGLMQLMPEIAALHGARDVHDPAQNIAAGARHLSQLLAYYTGDLVKTLAAYNAGERAVDRYNGVPPYDETQLYVRKTLAAYYGKAPLGGGFGKPATGTDGSISSPRGKPVQWMRDSHNRVLLTTKSRPAARRLG